MKLVIQLGNLEELFMITGLGGPMQDLLHADEANNFEGIPVSTTRTAS